MAWTLLFLQAGLFIPAWFLLVRPLCKASLLDYSVSALKPFVLAGLSLAPAFWIADQFDGVTLRLSIGIAIAAPFYVLFSMMANKEWITAMIELIGLPKKLMGE